MRTGKKRRPGNGAPQAFLLTATALGLALAGSAIAQQATDLRGGLLTDSENSASLPGGPADGNEVQDDTLSIRATPDMSADDQPGASGAELIQSVEAETPPAASRKRVEEETDDVTTATVREPPIDSLENQPLDPASERALPIEGLDRQLEENPYEALGIRWGSFILKPSLESGITATSNADSSVNGSSAVLSETTLRLNAASDWSSHRASIDAFGTFRKTLSGEEVDDFRGGVDADLEVELGNEYRAKGTFTYSVAPESAASPVIIPNTVEEPLTQTVGGTLGLEKDEGKARFAITGGVLHDAYGDADLVGGGVFSQKDRDSTLYKLALRAGYEISPALMPFVETELGRNQYDQKVDSAGYERSADIYALRGGLKFDTGEKLSGEVAVGWVSEHFDDTRLDTLSTPTIAGNVLWSPVRGTDVRLSGSTELEGTTTPGESGSVLYSTSLAVERLMRANLTGHALFGFGYRNYAQSDGYDTIWNAEAGLTWWLNRYAGITGRVRYEDVSSNIPGRDTDTSSVFLGLKLQR